MTITRAALFLSFCACYCAGMPYAYAIGPTPPSWKPRESVSDDGYSQSYGADHKLAFDHFGIPGVVVVSESDRSVRYARRVPVVG